MVCGVSSSREDHGLIYGKRGTRGNSMQGLGCLDDFTVKMQASEEFAATTVGVAQPITVTGHAGAYSLRIRVPGTGTGAPCSGLQSVGSNLVGVPVAVRYPVPCAARNPSTAADHG